MSEQIEKIDYVKLQIDAAKHRTRPGGSAFGPLGLTVREYFAAQAMSIWEMSEVDIDRIEKGELPNHKIVARFCVELADSLIEALNK